jgi:tetratricopeptide (TPR) repeat protein
MGILISYDIQHDYDRMDLLRKALIEAGWKVHGYTPIPADNTMNGVEMATEQQAEALKNADLLIVLLTPLAVKDEMIEDEVNYALKRNLPIIPIMINPTPRHLIPPALQDPLDATQDYLLVIAVLIDDIKIVFESIEHPLAYKYFQYGLNLNNNSDAELLAYSQAIEVYSGFADAYNNRGYIYSVRGQYDLALADFAKAIALDGEKAIFRLQRAGVLRQMQRYEEALSDCNLVLKKNPQHSAAWMNRGNVYRDMREFKRALQDYSQAIMLDASNYVLYHNRATVFKELGKLVEAEQDFLKVIDLQPNWAEAYRKLGLLYHSMGKHGHAAEMCKLVLQKDPKHPNAQQMQDYIRKYS